MCMEMLTQMLCKASSEGSVRYYPKCCKLNLTHLSFADDLMIFIEASPSSLHGFKSVLDAFQNMSGLGVSYNKSELFCS